MRHQTKRIRSHRATGVGAKARIPAADTDKSNKIEQALADFFAEAPIGLLLVRPNGRIQWANESLANMLGCSVLELLDIPLANFSADPDLITGALERLAHKQPVHEEFLWFRCKGGSLIPARAIANGLWEEDALIRSRWFIRDTTTLMELQKEILAINERVQERIGRDLHDDLCQRLTGIEFLGRALEKKLDGALRSESKRAREIANIARDALATTRNLSHGLAPMDAYQGSLPDALRTLANRTRQLFHVHCRFKMGGMASAVDGAAGIHLYRIAQEAINNAIKHGKARRIWILFKSTASHTMLEVTNDGAGLAPQPDAKEGIGLHIMDYRARSLGGSILVRNRDKGGVTLVCAIPNMQRNIQAKVEAANES